MLVSACGLPRGLNQGSRNPDATINGGAIVGALARDIKNPRSKGGGSYAALRRSNLSRVGAGRLNPPDGAGSSRGGGGAFRWQNFGWLVTLSRVVAGVSLVACVGGALAGGGVLDDAPRVGAEIIPCIDDMSSKYPKTTERHENTY